MKSTSRAIKSNEIATFKRDGVVFMSGLFDAVFVRSARTKARRQTRY